METNCPKCESEQTQSFEMANKAGTSSGRVVGVGMNMEGDVGVARGFSTQRTEIAKLTAPPPDVTTGETLVLIILCIVITAGVFIALLAMGYYLYSVIVPI